jgi:hypothetical protein
VNEEPEAPGHSKWLTSRVLMEDARELARSLLGLLMERNSEDWEESVEGTPWDQARLPDWITGVDQGRALWNGGEE